MNALGVARGQDLHPAGRLAAVLKRGIMRVDGQHGELFRGSRPTPF